MLALHNNYYSKILLKIEQRPFIAYLKTELEAIALKEFSLLYIYDKVIETICLKTKVSWGIVWLRACILFHSFNILL